MQKRIQQLLESKCKFRLSNLAPQWRRVNVPRALCNRYRILYRWSRHQVHHRGITYRHQYLQRQCRRLNRQTPRSKQRQLLKRHSLLPHNFRQTFHQLRLPNHRLRHRRSHPSANPVNQHRIPQRISINWTVGNQTIWTVCLNRNFPIRSGKQQHRQQKLIPAVAVILR